MFKKYLRDTSGQFAIMFAGAATMLLLASASAIDIIGMQKQKSQLQSMTDVAVLAAAVSRSDNVGELKQIANAAASANNLLQTDYKLNVSLDSKIIKVSGSADYDTQLMGVLGINKIPVEALSEAPIPEEIPVNIALVLDSTNSMAGDNMSALKSASKSLLGIFDASAPGTIQAGVVPYNQWVNVGLSNRNRSWMDVADDSTTTSAEICNMRKDIISQNCTSTTSPGTCRNDSGEYSCDKTSTTCTDQVYGAEYEYCYIPTSTQTWNGCVTSREDPFQFEPAYKGEKFVGVMNVSCGTEILDLTSSLTDVEAHIDGLATTGYTYIPAGLIWGWRMLHASEPFGGLTNAETKRKRALVLMTDGANTVYNDINSNHAKTLQPEEVKKANDYTSQLCTLIKEDGIDVYTVAYKLGTGDAATTQMVQECASSPAHSFVAENQEDLEDAFEQIASSLFEVRLSK